MKSWRRAGPVMSAHTPESPKDRQDLANSVGLERKAFCVGVTIGLTSLHPSCAFNCFHICLKISVCPIHAVTPDSSVWTFAIKDKCSSVSFIMFLSRHRVCGLLRGSFGLTRTWVWGPEEESTVSMSVL